MLPVSEQVEDAGDGGGGISRRSAVSLLFLEPRSSKELAAEADAVGGGVLEAAATPLLEEKVEAALTMANN
jgi:hypothetical protein